MPLAHCRRWNVSHNRKSAAYAVRLPSGASPSTCRRSLAVRAAGEQYPEVPERWWDDLRRGAIQGPATGPSANSFLGPAPEDLETNGLAEMLLGKKTYQQMEAADRQEAQRVWDAMRASAWSRYQNGEMPEWFDPEWLMQDESPVNRMLRLQDVPQEALTGGNGGGGGKKGGGDGGFWREDDPYWPLRDGGDHPMRWWTFAFAAVLALGGVVAHSAHGSRESLWVGGCLAAVLSMCAMAMSDMTDWGHGPLAVKVAWATCALLAAKEFWSGWTHRPVPASMAVTWGSTRLDKSGGHTQSSPQRLGGCGMACVAMCVLYMWTGMAEMDEWALPQNPGSVYKNPDVAYKHKVWKDWGYGDVAIRV